MRYRTFGIGTLVAGTLALGACTSNPKSTITLAVTKVGDIEAYPSSCTGSTVEMKDQFLVYARWFGRPYVVTAQQCEASVSAFGAIQETLTEALAAGQGIELMLDEKYFGTAVPEICAEYLVFNIGTASTATPPVEAPDPAK